MRPNPHSRLGTHYGWVSPGRTRSDWALAPTMLGATHPLVAVLHATQQAKDGLLALSFVELADVVLLVRGIPLAVPLALAAAVVQIALVVRLAAIGAHRQNVCRELIVGGREGLPLAAVEREVRRFHARRRRVQIARSIQDLADLGDRRRPQAGPGPPICDVRVLAAAAPRLREIAGLLKSDGPAVRGVALVDRLISDGRSPLYGRSVAALREELGRAHYLLLRERG